MSKNIRKFTSQADYDAYKANDGWDYPSVSFVETDIDSQVHYNNEFIMRWSTDATEKTPSFYGEVSHDDFKKWVEQASRPCRIPRNYSGDASSIQYYSLNSSNYSVNDWTEYDKTDPAYLHMTRIENINVGCFQDTSKKIKEIRFNFDKGCPDGFHKWFPHGVQDSEGLFENTSKLWGRYDITPYETTISDSTASSGHGLNVVSGVSLNASTNGTWSANSIFSATKKTNSNLLVMTYWEHFVLTMIFCAYYKTFNTQSKFNGIIEGSQSQAEAWTNGGTDSLLTHDGQVSTGYQANTGYRFMHLENPIHGLRWIWGAGWMGYMKANGGQYRMTFDDEKANIEAILAEGNADYTSGFTVPVGDTAINDSGESITGSLPWGRVEGKYVTDIDVYGVPCSLYLDGGSDYKKGVGSNTSGFYDAMWAYNPGSGFDRVAYLGGSSNIGVSCGGFARDFYTDASYASWYRRGRVTMNA